MTPMTRNRLSASFIALTLGFSSFGLARAQDGLPGDAGLIVGEVARCVNGAEQAAAQVSVGVEGGGSSLVRTDAGGQFFLSLPPGQYTITATAPDGSVSASRQYVPVEAGQALDIGILDLGGGVAGCGPDADITQPVLPTFTPTLTPVPVAPTAIPQPPAAPATPTPEPATEPMTEA
jgi:carboxypeptidase family protein